jgi:GT2 family glycosyltransferase
MSEHPSLAIVILNFNGRKHLETFLPSVVENSPGFKIYVADNGSTDDSILFLQTRFPQIHLIFFDKNHGFSRGYNLALQQVEAEFYVLLNSDVEVTPGWLSPMLALMQTNPQIAACQPKLLSYLQKDTFEYAGAAGGMLDWLGYPFCRGRIFDTLEKDTGQYDANAEIFWATGACMLVRSEIYHHLGGLDDDFFAHMEEIDFCWRVKNAGYQVFCCGESAVFHLGGGTLPKENPRKTFLNFRNGLALLYKNLPASRLFPVILLRLVLDGVAGVVFLLRGSPRPLLAVLQAHFNFYGNIFKWHQHRRKVQTQVIKHVDLYPESVVWKHFVASPGPSWRRGAAPEKS